jgi:hypothetical protein
MLTRVTAMRKILSVAFLIILIVVGFGLIGTVPASATKDSTNITGVITTDTTWTKADSPFVLTGLVGVAAGVTLTIEPGVIVNLGEFSLQVGGTLYARGGSDEDNITFISKTASYGNIAFTNGSTSGQTGSTSIIESAILYSTSVSINNVSLIINNNTITGSINIDQEAAPVISNNLITGDIGVHNSSPKIEHNSIIGGINIGGDWPVISNNIIDGGGITGIGIKFGGQYWINISGNIIYGCSIGISGQEAAVTIEKNLIIDNDRGMELSSGGFIANNTIAKNSIGIKMRLDATTIIGNNIQNNSQNSIYLEDTPYDVDATTNWWGTIETQLINLTIHDHKNEPKLGVVNIIPTLSSPVKYAPTTDYVPIKQSSLTPQEQNTDQTTSQPAIQIGILEIAVAATILSVIINISLVIVVARLLRKRQ